MSINTTVLSFVVMHMFTVQSPLYLPFVFTYGNRKAEKKTYLPVLCILVNTNRRKNVGGPGMRLVQNCVCKTVVEAEYDIV